MGGLFTVAYTWSIDTAWLQSMNLSRPSRFIATLVALFSVLFTQLAVAGYACPDMEISRAMEMAAMSAEMNHGMMTDCEDMDLEQPSLCHEHAQSGKQSLDKPQLPNVSPSMAILLVPAVGDIHLAWRPDTYHAEASRLMRTSAPPLSIRNCCFRI